MGILGYDDPKGPHLASLALIPGEGSPVKIYLAAPLFSQIQRAWNRRLAEAIRSELPGTTVFLPQDLRTEGRYNDPRHYGTLYRRCLEAIRESDLLLAILDGSDVDSGVAFEIGVASTLGKRVVGLRTDYRPGAEQGVNLMIARACRYLVREFAFQEDLGMVARSVCRRLRKIQRELEDRSRTEPLNPEGKG